MLGSCCRQKAALSGCLQRRRFSKWEGSPARCRAGPEIPDPERDCLQDLSDQAGIRAGWIGLSSLSGAETRRDPGRESLAWLLVLSLVYPSLAGGRGRALSGFEVSLGSALAEKRC